MESSELPSICWQTAASHAPCPIFVLGTDLTEVWCNAAGRDYVRQRGEATFLACLSPEDCIPSSASWRRSANDSHLLASDDGSFRVHTCDGYFVVIGTERAPLSVRRDPLTHLGSRDSLRSCLAKSLEGTRQDWGILFLDLDNYKQVNDRYGHLIGDRVLQEFAQQLAANARPTDAVFRYGGDEFVIVVNSVANEKVLRDIGQRICHATVVAVREQDPPLHVTASVGCAMAGPEQVDAETLLSRADRDMYRAKRAG